MAYQLGNGSVEVELSKLQSWVEDADIDLYGRNGDQGVVREHRDARAIQAEHEKSNRKNIAITALLVTGVPIAIKCLELMHIIPR